MLMFWKTWLPNLEDPYVHTEHLAMNDTKVEALMVPGHNEWDKDLIKDIFI